MHGTDQGDAMDDPPYEVCAITGWSEIVIARGAVIVEGGAVTVTLRPPAVRGVCAV